MANPFIGEIQMAGFNFAMPDWALCQGQLLPISQYQALFAIIGSEFGGDWRNTMGVPNLKSRTQVGDGTGPGLTPRYISQFGGYESVTLFKSELPIHTHGDVGNELFPDEEVPSSNAVPAVMRVGGSELSSSFSSTPVAGDYMSSAAISAVGGGVAHENRQPFLTLNFMLALDGIFPPRS